MRITQISQTYNNRTKSNQKQNFGAITQEAAKFAFEKIGKNAELLGQFLVTAKRARENTKFHVHYKDSALGLLDVNKGFERRYPYVNNEKEGASGFLDKYTTLVDEANKKAQVETELDGLKSEIMAVTVQALAK